MFEQDLGITLIIFFAGLIFGIILNMLISKIRSGSTSASKVKEEMEEYQDKVEAHFDETSNKFKQMATQYQDLYQHLSLGATSLCRPENIAPGLVGDASPLSGNKALEQKPQTENAKVVNTETKPKDAPSAKPDEAKKTESVKQENTSSTDADVKKTSKKA